MSCPFASHAECGCVCYAQLDVRYNNLGDEGKAVIQEAARSKKGFNLKV